MPWTQTALGIVDQRTSLFLGPFAHHQRHHQFAIGRDRGMVPEIPRFILLMCLATFLLFLTQLHGSSNSRAFGVMPCTC
jgi:hypothetical protein